MFNIIDIGFNSIFLKANKDLLELLKLFKLEYSGLEIEIKKTENKIFDLYNEEEKMFFSFDLKSEIKIDKYNFQYSNDEINILKKISEWPKCIDVSSNKLEPHRIPTYLYELASLFHSYWNLGKDNVEKRFINDQKKITDDKLVFLKAISNVIKNGMDIVGVSTPEKM